MTKETAGKRVGPDPSEPLAKRVRPDVTVYGVSHQRFVAETGRDFRRVIRHADHLLIEGQQNDITAHRDVARGLSNGIERGYESEAIGIFVSRGKAKNIHPLETPPWSYCKKYKLGWDILFAQRYLSLGLQGSGFSLKDLESYVEVWKKLEHPFLDNIGSEELVGVIQRVSRMIQPTLGRRVFASLTGERDRFITGVLAVSRYTATMRDHEAIVPNALRLANQLKGSKVVIVGKFHVPNQERAFSGLSLEPLLPWPDYVESLGDRQKRGVQTFQSIAQGHRK